MKSEDPFQFSGPKRAMKGHAIMKNNHPIGPLVLKEIEIRENLSCAAILALYHIRIDKRSIECIDL